MLLICGDAFADTLPKVVRYELQVQINPAEEQLTAATQITISSSAAIARREIPFLLYVSATIRIIRAYFVVHGRENAG